MMRAVYRVTRPIPEIGALPGDSIIAEPDDPSYPMVLTRRLPRGLLPLVLDKSRVRLLGTDGETQPEPPRGRPWRVLKGGA